MPAYFDTGFTVRTPAWHQQGKVLAEAPSWEDAREHAGLLWEPALAPMFQRKLKEVPLGVSPDGELVTEQVETFVEVPGGRLVVRDDTDAVIGRVGLDQTLFGNGAMWELLETLVDQGAKPDSGGSCKGGAIVWALAMLDEPFTLPGDDSQSFPYVSVVNHHDGTGSLRAQAGSVRIVCWNTVQAASLQSERSGRYFSFRHTANIADRVEDAKAALAGARQDAVAWQELATDLIGLPVTTANLSAFLSEFIPEPPQGVVSDRVAQNIATARATFRSCYDSVTNQAHRGTALGVVNASVEYLDHLRGYRNADSYLGRTLLKAEPLKGKAVKLIREVCAA